MVPLFLHEAKKTKLPRLTGRCRPAERRFITFTGTFFTPISPNISAGSEMRT